MGADLTQAVFGDLPAARSRGARSVGGARRPTSNYSNSPNSSRFLGLDLGLRLGWALLDAQGTRLAGGVLPLYRYGNANQRAQQAQRRIADLVQRVGSGALVAYELVRRHEGVQAAHVYGGLEWCLRAALGTRRAETVEVAVIKRVATGRGNADKASMLVAARTRWGADAVADDNEADALFIAEVVRLRHCGGRS